MNEINSLFDVSGKVALITGATGVNKPGPITEQPLQEWEMIMDANVKGTYLFCKEVAKVMISQGRGGKVILLGSARGDLGMANYSAYSPSKGAIHLMKNVQIQDLKPYAAPGHFGMTAMRMQGKEETCATKFWMGLSH
jgi:NAD(P)-dependent dehydrogenase (short-subunit alcohol dehydrogenase family)